MTWQTVKNVKAFLADKGTKRVRDAHSLKKRVAHWPYCEHCGLVALKNDVSRRALAAQCVVHE
jgi:hypothetical protein